MKKKLIILLSCIMFLSITAVSKENKILLRLNNEIITSVDILNEIKFLSILNKDFLKIDKNKKIEIAKNSQIKQKVKYIEILKTRKDLEIKNELFENILKNYFFNLKIEKINDFENYFKNKDLNPKFVKEKIIIETLWNKMIFDKFSNSVKIDKKEIENNIKIKKIQKEYLLSEIVFNLNANENLSEKLKLILNIVEKKNFSEAALVYSLSDSSNKGGELGWIKEGILSKKIKLELANLSIGEITEPITIPGGFLLLYLEDIKEIEVQLDVENEIKNIIERKTNTQLNQLSNVYLNKQKKNIIINEL
ncbi:peptidylprolyl isomerase [Candidatus Pelagibacter sp. HIMB1593]|uniref:peptidylprolyl isomerase n=1 Tax=Candidatus Pelagibacter sp. HIMB1593 TaxID=3413355 RepID=UPI003F8271D4